MKIESSLLFCDRDPLDPQVDKEIQAYQVIKVTLVHWVHQAQLGRQVNKGYPV